MYEIGPSFWSKAVFMAELLAAEALMVSGLKRRRLFPLRLAAGAAFCFGLSFAMPVIDGVAYSAFMFLALFAATLLCAKLCFDESFRTVLFCVLAGYAVQHIAFEFFDIAVTAMGIADMTATAAEGSSPLVTFVTFIYGSGNVPIGNVFVLIVYCATYFLTYWAAARLLLPRMRDISDMQLKNGSVLVIVLLTVIFNIVISVIVSEYGGDNFDRIYVILLDLTNVFCCALALYQQFSLAKMRRMGDNLAAVNRMWEQSKKQYDFAKENMELINLKCHDLKHQMHAAGSAGALDPAVAAEIEQIITAYDGNVETGNDALDVILTEKSLYCVRHDIALTCMADGKQLSFMSEADLYSLFGNLLDNAIEAVEKLDADRRAVGLTVKRGSEFVFVNVHNYYDGALCFDGELPRSTKGGAYHGFGMKSVRFVAEKYGGELSINAKDGIFDLDIIFPCLKSSD